MNKWALGRGKKGHLFFLSCESGKRCVRLRAFACVSVCAFPLGGRGDCIRAETRRDIIELGMLSFSRSFLHLFAHTNVRIPLETCSPRMSCQRL